MYISGLLTCRGWHWHLCVRVNNRVFPFPFPFRALSRRLTSSRLVIWAFALWTCCLQVLFVSLSLTPFSVHLFITPFLGRQSHLAAATLATSESREETRPTFATFPPHHEQTFYDAALREDLEQKDKLSKRVENMRCAFMDNPCQ